MSYATRGMSLLEAACHWEARTPDRVYLIQPVGGGRVRRYTWRETMDQARRMAAHLRGLSLPPGQIGLLTKNCAHFFIAELAAWMAGRATVAIFPTYDAKTLRHVLEHSDTRLLLVGKLDGWDELHRGISPALPCIALPLAPPTDFPRWEDIVARTEPMAGMPARGADELATILYTSGSTGLPKGVMHSFGGIAAAVHGLAERFADIFGEDSASHRLLSYLPLAHAFERLCVEGPSLVAGCPVFFAESLETFMDDLRRARPTMFVSVPRLWIKFQLGVFQKIPPRRLDLLLRVPVLSRLIRRKILAALGLDAVRHATSGSAPLPPDVLTWYRRLGLELHEGYGMTEDFAYSHCGRRGEGRPGYVGSPLPGVEIRLADDGEVLIRSPSAMMGYHKDPALTAESRTQDGFFRTGDLGERDREGRLRITGRVKELFKTSKGKYVAPAPIESLLNNDPRVEQSCVLGAGMTRPLGLVLLAEELRGRRDEPETRRALTRSLESLLETVNRTVLRYECLERLVVVKDPWQIENGYLTATMKIRRGTIEAAYAPKLDGWYGASDPVVWES